LNVRQLVLVAVAALAVGGTAVAEVGQSGPAGQVTPPPPPPPNGNVATPGTLIGTPAPAATPAKAGPTITPAPATTQAPPGRRGRRSNSPEPAASPSDTPEPPQFSTMDGVWEVQLQPLTGNGRAIYSHFALAQKGDQLSGTWNRDGSPKIAFTGTFDGRLFKLNATDGKTTWTFSGYAENFSDMVGLLQTADPKDRGTPFTASHRKKDRI
jgi:outer membrane protein assembly factor BamB